MDEPQSLLFEDANYDNGFVGDVRRLQSDYFAFMCWFYMAPLMCDLRNAALRENAFSFDQPVFAVLYGSSNCGKTSLVETLMASMFSYPRIVDTQNFTPAKLRALQQAYKRFPRRLRRCDPRPFQTVTPTKS